MKNLSKNNLKPTTLRLLLTLCMFAILGLSIGGFVLIQQKISAFAVEVSHKKVDAAASKASLQTLQRLQKELTANSSVIEKAKNIKHASSLPQFKAIEDIRNHGKANGLTVSDITFTAISAGSTPAPSAPVAPAAPGAPPAASADGVDITFNLGSGSIPAINFVNFLYDIEHTTPKMQLQSIEVSAGSGPSDVTVGQMTVKMFTKQASQ